MYYLSDISEFARKKGSKDKQKRKVGLFDTNKPSVVGQKSFKFGPKKGKYMSKAQGAGWVGLGTTLGSVVGGTLGLGNMLVNKKYSTKGMLSTVGTGAALGAAVGGGSVYNEHRNSKYSSLYKGKKK